MRSKRLSKTKTQEERPTQSHHVFRNAEIVRLIAEHFFNQRSLGSLASLTRTNHLFYDVCIPLLYRNLVFTRAESISSFATHVKDIPEGTLNTYFSYLRAGKFTLEGVRTVMEKQRQHRQTRQRSRRLLIMSKEESVPILASIIRARKNWEYVELLELDHQMLSMDAHHWLVGGVAILGFPLAFPKLKRIIIRRSTFTDNVSPLSCSVKAATVNPAFVLTRCCNPVYLCVEHPPLPATTPEPPSSESGLLWNVLALGCPSLKAVIIHDPRNIRQFICGSPIHRLDGDFADLGAEERKRLTSILTISILPMDESCGLGERDPTVIELRDATGLKDAIDFKLEGCLPLMLGEDVPQDTIRTYLDKFRYLGRNEPRPDCQACGRAML